MSNIQIICTSPGIRRNGIEHPASAVYPAGHWSEDQIIAFRRDQAFVVQDVAEGGVKLSGDDFDIAVAAEVAKQVETITAAMQLSYNNAVTTAVNEKLATVTADHDNAIDALGKKLEAANGQIAELTTAAALASIQPEAPAAEPEKKTTAKK